ncbi:MAG: CrcB family protein, partial [Pseudomonadales bacterium]
MFKANIIVAVVIGASLGALLRWWLSVKFNALHDALFLGTLLANVIACSLMGFYLGYETAANALSPAL